MASWKGARVCCRKIAISPEPGKVANLVLLKKSPLERVDAYDIVTIWVHGKQLSRDSLTADAKK